MKSSRGSFSLMERSFQVLHFARPVGNSTHASWKRMFPVGTLGEEVPTTGDRLNNRIPESV